jgi:hypothetical protein
VISAPASPAPNSSSSTPAVEAQQTSPSTKKKRVHKKKKKAPAAAVPADAANTSAAGPDVSNDDPDGEKCTVGRDALWHPYIMAILHEYLAEYIHNRLDVKNMRSRNGQVNARIANRLGPLCEFNLIYLNKKIPGAAFGSLIFNTMLPMAHIPLADIPAIDYAWNEDARNKFRKECRKVRATRTVSLISTNTSFL